MNNLIDKICLITGASSGIGKITAHQLAQQGATIIMVSSNLDRGKQVLNEIQKSTGNQNLAFFQCDLTSQISIHKLVAKVKAAYHHVDILINNAGGLMKSLQMTEEGIEKTFALNHIAPFLLTHLLLDQLKKSSQARIINVTSSGHSVGVFDLDNLNAEKSFNGPFLYVQAKLANILFTYELARRLKETAITVNCLHPGFVQTNFGENANWLYRIFVNRLLKPFMISPEEGAQTTLYLATSNEVKHISGKYFVKKKPVKSARKTYDESLAKQLWGISEKLTNLNQINS
ncbi:NAD(P)-dependent dehydrogenase, short-chain alcohol dehydrogenase family [Seinonella peptonophila]|uniref:NAD(P)-dependent dehydrogenase, short-chain alcohol dehydrogenase family n=1 Tax=Seinonella peptonophila TaxID=112248 RepID=A0A1M5AD64_9BACL|nr:SDR family oxidoreductase [Seinonella peptonophila]SHF27832.1 NAD(P)-dependent dehydrogenase, short-chain alcohol dehydrogenase family [Seinonella peptonophila]